MFPAPFWFCQRVASLLLFCCALTYPALASAQGTAADKAAAEALFNDALALLDAKQPAEACPKLEESQRLDPGVGTLLYLADCYRQLGRTASAWATFRDAAYRAKEQGDEREAVAVELAGELEPKLSYLTIRVDAAVEGLVIEHDEAVVGAALYGTRVPVDPGEHRIAAHAEGFLPWSDTVTVEPGSGSYEVTVPRLEVAPAPEPEPVEIADQPPTPQAKKRSGGWYGPVGWTLVGTGVVGLAGGALFAAGAKQADQDADASCRPDIPTLCNDTGVEDAERARGLAALSGLSAVVGLAALGTGVTLLFLRPSDTEKAPSANVGVTARLSARGSQLTLEGTW